MRYKVTSNHEYKLGIEKDEFSRYYGYLVSNIYYNGGWIDKIICGLAYDDEENLSSGRFIHYVPEQQEFIVQKHFKSDLSIIINKTNLFLSTIETNIHNKWNVIIWLDNFSENGLVIYDFSFENEEDALLFKLVS